MGRDRLARVLQPSCLEEPGHRGTKAGRLGGAVRIEKIIAMVLHEVYGRQVEGVMDTLEEGPEGFYG